MSERVYRLVELFGAPTVGGGEPIRSAIATSSEALRHVVDGREAHFRVTLKVGFRLES